MVRKSLDMVFSAGFGHGNISDLLAALHRLMHGSFNKRNFAASIFEVVAADEPIACPKYIRMHWNGFKHSLILALN